MKAAVLHAFGETPRYEEFAEPTPGPDDIVLQVRAVGLENFDRALAQGNHYSVGQLMPTLPAILGTDGIGQREDGELMGFGGTRPPYGSMAERAIVPKLYTVPIPAGVDAAVAATVPSSALTALFPLKWGARLQPEETVLIQGATGFAGKLAVQIAKLLGTKRIVATGRNDAALHALRDLGADAVIDLKQSDDQVIAAFQREAGESGYGVILDFLWGRPTELLLQAIVPHELSFPKGSIRLMQIGEKAGATLSLPANAMRTSGLEIKGGGGGLTPEAVGEGTQLVWAWLQEGKLHADIERVPLKDIESAWQRADIQGKRLVIIP
jgi:NADPH2:quinone reductase